MGRSRLRTRQQAAQAGLLALAGYNLERAAHDVFEHAPKHRRKENLRAGRHHLRQLTGHDCGYDLADWWNLLMAWQLNFTRLQAFPRVLAAVRIAMNDPLRQEHVKELIAEDAALNPTADPSVLS